MDVEDSSDIIDIIDVKHWQNEKTINKITKESTVDPIFKFSIEINNKIAIWTGSIYKLKADAIVIPINNFIDGKLSIETSRIYKLAGNKYARSFINTVIGCKTSEIRVTDGYDLPCHHVFHTVVPRYNPKYESAAVNAIYNCFRNSLLTSMDMNIRKIGFATLHLSKYSFPNDIAIHITARTIRRFLEKYSEFIDIIVLQVSEELIDMYNEILPIYFPRNANEENYSMLNIPDDLGNEDGQPTLPDREIRITAFPYGPKNVSHSDDSSDEELEPSYTKYSDITSSSRRCLSQTHVAPAVLRQSLGGKHQGQIAEVIQNYEGNLTLNRRFDRLLREGKKMDMTHLTELRVFYQCGKDIRGQPILLVVERNIPSTVEENRNEILSFIINTLEKTSKGKPFSIIYAHTESTFRPSRNFLSEMYEVLRIRYAKFLNCICMVHPSLYVRGLNWLFTTFHAPQLKSKMYNVINLRQLYRLVNPALLELPDFIYQYDKLVGGSNRHSDYAITTNPKESPDGGRVSVPSIIHEEL